MQPNILGNGVRVVRALFFFSPELQVLLHFKRAFYEERNNFYITLTTAETLVFAEQE